jgi:hypothetical protein
MHKRSTTYPATISPLIQPLALHFSPQISPVSGTFLRRKEFPKLGECMTSAKTLTPSGEVLSDSPSEMKNLTFAH